MNQTMIINGFKNVRLGIGLIIVGLLLLALGVLFVELYISEDHGLMLVSAFILLAWLPICIPICIICVGVAFIYQGFNKVETGIVPTYTQQISTPQQQYYQPSPQPQYQQPPPPQYQQPPGQPRQKR